MTSAASSRIRRDAPWWMLPVFGAGLGLWFLVAQRGLRPFVGEGLYPWVLGLGLALLMLLAARIIHTHMIGRLEEAQRAVTQSTADLSSFFDLLPVGALFTDGAGKITRCNRKGLELLGMTEAQVLGSDFSHPDFLILQTDGNPMDHEDRPLIRALKSGHKVKDIVLGLERPSDGEWAWLTVTADPRQGEDGLITDVLLTFDDVTQRRAAENELAVQTFRDRLTGLPNRALFMERLTQALVRMERRKVATGVIFLDLDRFKVVNDSLGHESGDLLLAQVSRRVRHSVRPEDTLARLSGDEFIVLLEDLQQASDGIKIAERITEAFADPFVVEGQEIYTTCSMGFTLTSGTDTVASELIRDAEVAMYRAKARGEGSIEIFDASMNAQARERFQLESELRRGLERKEFILYYQPLVGLESGQIEGWEALIRWKHPERGMVPPLDFIPLAEETGLIVPLGKWVLEEAVRQATLWNDRFASVPAHLMSVNISGRQFQQRDLVAIVSGSLLATGYSPSCLKLEITESVMMRDPQSSLESMKALSGMDVHLVIDDFGTGYSSLSYLKRFPVDTLKVDKSFVDGLGKDPESSAIVSAVISMAKSLGMRVTAEGIETAEQLALLRELKCDQGQGYFFSRPLPAEPAEELLARQPRW